MEQLKMLGRELATGAQGSTRGFLEVVKAIGECKSKAEEDKIMMAEMEMLKKRIGEPDIPKRKMKEYIMRLVYLEMLGHDASFGYIHAVKMTHDDNLLLKRSGYLAVTLFLEENHDLIILIVNTIQKDLKSDNHLVVCAALSAVCKLINEETIPAVLPQILDLLTHSKEVVRKKAIMALHRFYQRSPSSVSHVIIKFRQALADKDPSVMSAAVCALYDLIAEDPKPYKNLVVSFVSILKQVAESRLPHMYNYHKTPAPFVQIKLLKVLALLGANDKGASEKMYGVLVEVIKRADSASTIGNAILYECCCTITAIHRSNALLSHCADIIARLIKSDVHNLKYMGIDALGRIVKVNSDFGNEHQLAVIDCLEDPDETLKRKTFDLLYKMTNPKNVDVIVDRMVQYMAAVQDSHGKLEIASRISELAERFAPSNHWFIQTMNSVFLLAGDLVRPKLAHDLMRLIAEGNGEEDDDADRLLRSSAVESYLKLLQEPKLPPILLQVICWVLGEYGVVDGAHRPEEIICHLCDAADSLAEDDSVRAYAATAIMKIIAFEVGAGRTPRIPPEASTFINDLSASHSTDLQQRAYELQSVIGLNPGTVAALLPADASCEDIEVDARLSFLDSFVQQALDRGAQPYLPESDRLANGHIGLAASLSGAVAESNATERSLRFEAYETPTIPTSREIISRSAAVPNFESSQQIGRSVESRGQQDSHGLESSSVAAQAEAMAHEATKLRLEGVHRKWGRSSLGQPPQPDSHDKSEGNGFEETLEDKFARESSSSGAPDAPARYPDRQSQQPEVSEEKRRLAASLFGGVSRADSATADSAVPTKVPARSQSARGPNVSKSQKMKEAVATPQPDLLDFGIDEPAHPPATVSDPFKDLESLLGPSSLPSVAAAPAAMDLLGSVQTSSFNDGSHQPAHGSNGAMSVLGRDARVRQVGVVPAGENPELLKNIFS